MPGPGCYVVPGSGNSAGSSDTADTTQKCRNVLRRDAMLLTAPFSQPGQFVVEDLCPCSALEEDFSSKAAWLDAIPLSKLHLTARAYSHRRQIRLLTKGRDWK